MYAQSSFSLWILKILKLIFNPLARVYFVAYFLLSRLLLSSQRRFKKERALMPPGGHVLKQRQRRAIFFVLFLYLGSILISGGKKPCKVGPDRSFSRPAWLVTAPEGLAGPPNVASRPGRNLGRRCGGPGGRDLRPTAHTEACSCRRTSLNVQMTLAVYLPRSAGPAPSSTEGSGRPRGAPGDAWGRKLKVSAFWQRSHAFCAVLSPLFRDSWLESAACFGLGPARGLFSALRAGAHCQRWRHFVGNVRFLAPGEWPFQTVIALCSPPFFIAVSDFKNST